MPGKTAPIFEDGRERKLQQDTTLQLSEPPIQNGVVKADVGSTVAQPACSFHTPDGERGQDGEDRGGEGRWPLWVQTEEDDEVEETEVRVMGATLGVMPLKFRSSPAGARVRECGDF